VPGTSSISWSLAQGLSEIDAIALRIAQDLVYATNSPREFRHISLFGTGDSLLFPVPGGGRVSDIAAVGSTLYWTDSTGIHRANSDGTGHTVLRSGNFVGVGLDVNSTHIFYAGITSTTLRRRKLDGSQDAALVFGDSFGYPRLDGLGKVYWVNRDDNTIKRANLDGSGIETIVGDPSVPGYELVPWNLSLEVGAYSCTRTEKYGDIVSPFFDGGANPLQPDFKDISKTVSCFQGGCDELEFDMADVDPCWDTTNCAGNGTIDFKDIAKSVSLFQGSSPCP